MFDRIESSATRSDPRRDRRVPPRHVAAQSRSRGRRLPRRVRQHAGAGCRARSRTWHCSRRRPARPTSVRSATSNSTSASSTSRWDRWPRELRPRIAAIQTVGGCGALRLGAELLRVARPDTVIHVSTPTWANHEPLVGQLGAASASVTRTTTRDAAASISTRCMRHLRRLPPGARRAAARLLPQPDRRRPRAGAVAELAELLEPRGLRAVRGPRLPGLRRRPGAGRRRAAH